MDEVSVAVVGAGAMGANHVRIYSRMKGVHLAGIVEPDRERAALLAERFGCAILPSIDAVPDVAEAVSICAPSSLHAEVACALLERGVHCLVEKPLAGTAAEAEAIAAAVRGSSAKVLVGHVERFNPAVRELRRISDGQEIVAVEAHRLNAVSKRIADVDVTADLMVHDIDIVLDVLGEVPDDIVARGVARTAAEGADYVTALLGFPSGALATLTASRITQHKIRSLEVTTPQRYFTVDYGTQELRVHTQTEGQLPSPTDEAERQPLYTLDMRTERVFVRMQEPLVAELDHFLDVVRGMEEPLVTADGALASLAVVWQIQEQVRR